MIGLAPFGRASVAVGDVVRMVPWGTSLLRVVGLDDPDQGDDALCETSDGSLVWLPLDMLEAW